mgnify:FL=1
MAENSKEPCWYVVHTYSGYENKVANDLQQSGNLDTMNAIGLTGEVYVPILENAKGKVTLIVQERFTEMDAICPAGPLKTGQRVQVTGVVENDVLVVAPID